MGFEAVVAGAGRRQLVGVASADQVNGDRAMCFGDVGKHVVPQEGRHHVAVKNTTVSPAPASTKVILYPSTLVDFLVYCEVAAMGLP